MSQTITTRKLGELLHHWHESQSDPIYATGSLLFAGKPVDEELVKKTRDKIRKLLASAERGSHGWGQDEVEELKTISDGLAGLLRVYEFGEMPTLADFRSHLTHDRNDQGHRYINSGKPILELEFKTGLGVAASQGAEAADRIRASAGKGRTDITLDTDGTTVKLGINNIEALYYFLQGLVEVGGAGNEVAKTIMEDLGYSWTGKANPAKRGGSKGGVMLNDAPYNIEKHLRMGDEVRGRDKANYFIRVLPPSYEGGWCVFQTSLKADFNPPLTHREVSIEEAAHTMSERVGSQYGLTWHRKAKSNPSRRRSTKKGRRWP